MVFPIPDSDREEIAVLYRLNDDRRRDQTVAFLHR